MNKESSAESVDSSSTQFLPKLFGGLSGRRKEPARLSPHPHPLVVAVHGGTYNSAYFDIPGYSLLARATALGLPVIALDRPGYGESIELKGMDATLQGNAAYLRRALGDAWNLYRGSSQGIVIIAHSIGAAISMLIASEPLDWPLLGLAISGVGLRTPPEHRQAWAALPDTYRVEIPGALKDQVMFGPAGSYDDKMPAASHLADAPAPKAELVDIVSTWQDQVRGVASRISVPVHYRQGEFDGLWIVGQEEVTGFAQALTNSPRVDGRMMTGVGHCIDFHRVGASFHAEQLEFAVQCAAPSR